MNIFKNIFSKSEKSPEKEDEKEIKEKSLTTREKLDFIELYDKSNLEEMGKTIKKEENEEKKEELKKLRLKLLKRIEAKEFKPKKEENEKEQKRKQELLTQREFLYKEPEIKVIRSLLDNSETEEIQEEEIEKKIINEFKELSLTNKFLVYRWLKEKGKLKKYPDIKKDLIEPKKLECKLVLGDLRGILHRAILKKYSPNSEKIIKPEKEKEIINGLKKSLVGLPLGEEFFEYGKEALTILKKLKFEEREKYEEISGKNDETCEAIEINLSNWLTDYKGPKRKNWEEELIKILKEEEKEIKITERDKKDINDILKNIEKNKEE